MEQTKESGIATAGFVLGIIGIVLSFIPFINILSYIMAILSIIFGIVTLAKKSSKGKAITALVLGICTIGVATSINGSTVGVLSDVINELDTTVTSIQTQQENEAKEYGVGEEAKLGNTSITVTKVQKSQGNSWDKPKTGKEFVIVYVTIENKGNSNVSYNPYYFEMINSQGNKENETFTTIDNDTSLNSGELIPGGRVSGTVVFEQPKGDNGLILTYSDNIWSSKEVKIKL